MIFVWLLFFAVGRSVVHQKLHSCFSCLLFTLLVLNYVRLFQAWWLFSAHIKTHTKMIMESNATHTDPTKTTDFKVACVFWVVAAFHISDELPQRNPLFLRTITHTHIDIEDMWIGWKPFSYSTWNSTTLTLLCTILCFHTHPFVQPIHKATISKTKQQNKM